MAENAVNEYEYVDAVPVPREAPIDPPTPKVVDVADRLRVELIELRLKNVTLELTLLSSQVNDKTQERTRVMQDALALRSELLERYGFDVYQGKINKDGTFTPNGGMNNAGPAVGS